MSKPPERPKLYHITSVENLPSIIADGQLVSDAVMVARGGPAVAIGMSSIKKRRLQELQVPCHSGTLVGDYVPFYFCPRSVMLFLIYRANHPDLNYRGGQRPILHLEADLHEVVAWADEQHRPWAFSLSNAGARYTQFENSVGALERIDWEAIANGDFREAGVKERKQAEFLIHESMPWTLIKRIGVVSLDIQSRIEEALEECVHKPSVQCLPTWYY